MEPRIVKLPSGATLKVAPAPFSDAKALYKAILAETKTVSISAKTDLAEVLKDLYCIGFSSDKIEDCLKNCLKRCTYNENRITDETFEPVEARQDYTKVCLEVVEENILPFAKNLYAELKNVLAPIGESPA